MDGANGEPDRHPDVVVVGAGLAGLRAAVDLVDAGMDVVVLEARGRVGGRVHSHRFANGQWCERGAEFVDAAHAEVLALADELGLTLTPSPSGDDDARRLVDLGGRTAPFALHDSLRDDLARWHEALAGVAALVDPDDPSAGPHAARLDGLALSDLVHDLGLGLTARVVIGRDIRTEYMVGPDRVSQLMAGWMTSLHLTSGDGFEAYRIEGGNDRLATGLSERLGDRIRLGAAVSSIDADGTVTLASGGRLRGGRVIVTLPLPVLGRVWDAMPAALGRAGYGIGGKISVQVARRVWHDIGADGSVRTERAWGEIWETTDGQSGDMGVLTCLLSSDDGAALVSLPDASARVVREMDRIFPGVHGLAGETVVTDWTNDPWSLGAYVTFGPGELLPAWREMQRDHGALVLAGEHTDRFAGYMEGALRSGRRAARRVLSSLA